MEPDFNRILTTLNHEEPDRVPIAEAALGYGIMSFFLDKPVTDKDVAGQLECWYKAGYDFVPLTVGLMYPGGVTRDSQISKVIDRTLVKEEAEEEGAWNVWKRSRIHTESDFETFP